VRLLADLAEHPRSLAAGNYKKLELARGQFFEQAWERCRAFLRVAQAAYVSRFGDAKTVKPTDPVLLGPAFRERLRAAMRIPAIEALFPTPWTAAARRVLPSPSPQFTATAMWGPVLAWCVLELLAESIDAENPEPVALDLFDRLRLREPFAKAFATLGFEGETGWRVAARIKVVLLTGAGVGRLVPSGPNVEPFCLPQTKPAKVDSATPAPSRDAPKQDLPGPLALSPALQPALWSDPDVRWLTGVHEAQGHDYFLRESYEELLWWLLLPPLLRAAGEAFPSRATVAQMTKAVEESLAEAETAGYRVDEMVGQPKVATLDEGPAPPIELQEAEPEEGTIEPEPLANDSGETQTEMETPDAEEAEIPETEA
jgi:hypothetical protein